MSTILVLDDAPSTHARVEDALSSDHSVHTASTWTNARSILEQEPVDHVFLSLWFNQTYALDLIDPIRTLRDVRITLLTDYTDANLLRETRIQGADGIISKPLTPELLQECLTEDPAGTNGDSGSRETLTFHTELRVCLLGRDPDLDDQLTRLSREYPLDVEVLSARETLPERLEKLQPHVVIVNPDRGEPNALREWFDQLEGDLDDSFLILVSDAPGSRGVDAFPLDRIEHVFHKPLDQSHFLHHLSYLSFVIDYHENGGPRDEPRTERSGESLHRWLSWPRVSVAVAAVLVGFLLGTFVNSLQRMSRDMVHNPGPDIEQMYEEVRGYLERDERRETNRTP